MKQLKYSLVLGGILSSLTACTGGSRISLTYQTQVVAQPTPSLSPGPNLAPSSGSPGSPGSPPPGGDHRDGGRDDRRQTEISPADEELLSPSVSALPRQGSPAFYIGLEGVAGGGFLPRDEVEAILASVNPEGGASSRSGSSAHSLHTPIEEVPEFEGLESAEEEGELPASLSGDSHASSRSSSSASSRGGSPFGIVEPRRIHSAPPHFNRVFSPIRSEASDLSHDAEGSEFGSESSDEGFNLDWLFGGEHDADGAEDLTGSNLTGSNLTGSDLTGSGLTYYTARSNLSSPELPEDEDAEPALEDENFDIKIAAGVGFTLISDHRPDRGFYGWGKADQGQLGLQLRGDSFRIPMRNFYVPVPMRQIAAGNAHSCFISAEGDVWCSGKNSFGQLGNGQSGRGLHQDGFERVLGLPDGRKRLALGYDVSCALTVDDGRVWCWGRNRFGFFPGVDARIVSPAGGRQILPLNGIPTVSQMSIGYNHACAVAREDRSVWCWGNNEQGQLGVDQGYAVRPERVAPRQVQGLPAGARAEQVHVGKDFSCAKLVNGDVYCWGGNRFGQLGRGFMSAPGALRLGPQHVQFGGLPVQGLSVGAYHACARVADGLQCWGLNESGQLGDGTFQNRSVPTDVPGLHQDVLTLVLGGYHTCAVLTEDRICCMGSHEFGQLGDGRPVSSRAKSSVPVSVFRY